MRYRCYQAPLWARLLATARVVIPDLLASLGWVGLMVIAVLYAGVLA